MKKDNKIYLQDMRPELPIKEAVTMRNELIHAYDNVDINEIWKTTQKDLPLLHEQVSRIIQEQE